MHRKNVNFLSNWSVGCAEFWIELQDGYLPLAAFKQRSHDPRTVPSEKIGGEAGQYWRYIGTRNRGPDLPPGLVNTDLLLIIARYAIQ